MIGRDAELEKISRFLCRLPAGGIQVMVIEGPPGSGKSRLLCEAGRLARQQGFTVRSSTLAPAAGAAPAASRTGSRPASAAAGVSRGAETPELTVVDGAHSLAPAAIAALLSLQESASSRAACMIAVRRSCWRDGSRPGPGGFAGPERIRLPPLADGAVSEIAASALGARPGDALTGLLRAATGNPLLVMELIRGLGEEHALAISAGTAVLTTSRVPDRVGVVVRDWLCGLSEATRQFLWEAATLGESFTLSELARLRGEPPAALVPALDEALEYLLASSGGDRFAFRHPLLWRVLAEAGPGLRPAERAAPRERARAAARPAGLPGPPAQRHGTASQLVPALLLARGSLQRPLHRGVREDLCSGLAYAMASAGESADFRACSAQARLIGGLFTHDESKARRRARQILAGEPPTQVGQAIAATVASNLAWADGRLDSGMKWGRHAANLAGLLAPAGWRAYPLLALAMKLAEAGDAEEAQLWIKAAQSEPGDGVPEDAAYVALGRARLLLTAGKFGQARREAEAAMALAGRLALGRPRGRACTCWE